MNAKNKSDKRNEEVLQVFSGLEYKQKIAFNRPFFPEYSSILILKSGKVVFEKGLRLVELSTPVIAFFDATTVYEFLHISDDLDAYVISVSTEYYNSLSTRFNTLKAYHYFKNNIGKAYPIDDDQLTEILSLVTALRHILRNTWLHPDRKELMDHLFYCIVHAISDYFEAIQDIQSATSRKDAITLAFLQNVEANFREQKDVAFYAAQQFITVRYLSAILKKTLGKTGIQVINEFLQKEAMALLADTHKSISDIAEHLGFADSQAFYHFFRRVTGVTPTQYRKHFSGN